MKIFDMRIEPKPVTHPSSFKVTLEVDGEVALTIRKLLGQDTSNTFGSSYNVYDQLDDLLNEVGMTQGGSKDRDDS